MQILITELKNRSLLILFNGLFFINLLYLYKDIVFFIIIKKLVFQNNITNYLVYSNIIELFSIYLTLINFINIHFIMFSFIFHFYIFISAALLNKEYFLIKNACVLIIQAYIFLILLIVKLFPVFFNYFEKYQEPFVHFELKINEFLWVFIYLIKSTQIYLVIILTLYKMNNIKFIKKTVVRKFYYFTYASIVWLTGLTNDIFTILIVSFLITVYETILIVFIFETKLKIK